MTRHNATWSEEHYNSDDDSIEDNEQDPELDEHGKRGYWDYRDEN